MEEQDLSAPSYATTVGRDPVGRDPVDRDPVDRSR